MQSLRSKSADQDGLAQPARPWQGPVPLAAAIKAGPNPLRRASRRRSDARCGVSEPDAVAQCEQIFGAQLVHRHSTAPTPLDVGPATIVCVPLLGWIKLENFITKVIALLV